MILVQSTVPIAGPSTSTSTSTSFSLSSPERNLANYSFGRHSAPSLPAPTSAPVPTPSSTPPKALASKKPRPCRSTTRTRLADHLLETPGVSFASWLTHHSASLGTIRTVSLISRKPLCPASVHPSPQASDHSPPPSDPSTQNTQTAPSPEPKIQSPSPSQLPSNPPFSSPSPPSKPKSWADLLRTAPKPAPDSSSSLTPPRVQPSQSTFRLHPSANRSRPTLLANQLEGIASSKPETFPLVPRGLINNGNICFANAILQVLVYCVPFHNLFKYLGRVTTHDFRSQTPLLDAMIGLVNEFKQESANDNQDKTIGDSFIAETVWWAMKGNKRFDGMRGGQQEDAQEFLGFFLDTLHEEILAAIERHDAPLRKLPAALQPLDQQQQQQQKTKQPSTTSAGLVAEGWMEVGSKGRAAVTRSTESSRSPISSIFSFNTRSVLHRSGQKDSVTLEPNNMLQLSIEHPSIQSIDQALARFSSPDVISDMRSRTGARVAATKTVYLDSFPPVLVLHLKRFEFDKGNVKKSAKEVKFEERLVVPASIGPKGGLDVAYKLFAVVYHHGPSAAGGHYTVSIRQPVSDRWIFIDDTQINFVSPFDEDRDVDRTPYLLFYTRN